LLLRILLLLDLRLLNLRLIRHVLDQLARIDTANQCQNQHDQHAQTAAAQRDDAAAPDSALILDIRTFPST